MKKPADTFAPTSLRDGADFPMTGQDNQLLSLLERIACALERQNEIAREIDNSLIYIGNMVEVLPGRGV